MKIKIKKLPSNNKFSYGGSTNKLSGDFTNNVTFIDEGGTHEQNPFEGVPFGIDRNNTPNLVEEGEVIWNDYVFSNRLTPSKKMLENIGFPEKYKDYSFALIAEELQKESAERPNDLISQKGLQDSMQRLIGLQEEVRNKRKDVQEKKAQKALENTFADGGNVNKLLGDEDSQYLSGDDYWGTGNTGDYNYGDYPGFTLEEVEAIESDPSSINYVSNSIDPEIPDTAGIMPSDFGSSKFDWGALGNGLMRMAPAITNAIDLARNLKKPDYSEGDRVLEAANAAPISNVQAEVEDINIRPIDRNYLLNQQLNQGNTLISNMGNQAINAQQAMANMMLANNQTQQNIGNSLIQMEEANLGRQMQEAEFNRGNDQIRMQTAFQNYANNAQRHQGIVDATKYSSMYNTQVDAARAQGISGAMGNLANSIAGIGTENTWKNIINKNKGLLYNTSGEYKQAKNGGRLLTKKRRRNYGK